MGKAMRASLLETLNSQVDEIAEHVAAVLLSSIPGFADRGDDLHKLTTLTLTDFLRHADGARTELDPLLIDRAHELARSGLDGGSAAHFWRVISQELWSWLTVRNSAIFDLRGDGLAVWNGFLATHERYAAAFMDAFFETQSELRAAELSCRRVSLDDLLAGKSPDQTESMLQVLGIRTEQVVIARFSFTGDAPNDPSDPGSRFQPLIREMQAHTRRLPWTVSDGSLVLCLPYDERTRDSIRRLSEHLDTNVRIGISRPWPVAGSLAAANRQAELARRGAGATTRIVDFGTLSLMQVAALHVDLPADDVPESLNILFTEDAKSDHEWLRTAEALLQAHGSISGAANLLRVHMNTIYYRIAAARRVTGLDLRSPGVLADIQFLQTCRSFGRYVA
ncbi:PucR family transcriptional regulator [Actinoplanes sp. TBRC 11911]|uniref:PucR family transcriptional regulator n=1 Tax=Actinoplanes sp. TBRC 11911 TaxID=2729386 RepID=UPI00145CB69A|nr:PucR family transcriptional regulator [Actinoplanes sp. TBRC 11911]NMO55735.1 PucR family transcriptional regulator [Actinoplanes sp. TBRC 11911]